MPASANGTKAKTVDYTSLKRARTYEWHEMEAAPGDDRPEPLRVKLQRLTTREQESMPEGGITDTEAMVTIAPFIAEWNLTAETGDGETVPVPVPSAVDDPADLMMQLLYFEERSWLYAELKMGAQLKVLREKKALMQFATTLASQNAPASPDGA